MLVTHGREDRNSKLGNSEYTAKTIPGAKLSVYDGIGHAPFYEDAPRTWGLSAITDQQLAGATMALEQAFVFFAVFARWFARFLAEQDEDAPVAPA